ncbi:hypothetical protein L249_4515 [Ophiocordyceps polyrhachis-furcata BCC 54312]|uniref:Ribonucleases P/MRP subunit Pop8-like domain-containing protein n=1 Tax=Ophiocordyceps polyrhachis-furcata BCC 54312 TaxID=1330021 RepID=A0A367KZ87_9HYPO|nr:hypothetical protein L249_4515 [Ophiocordyceps polyrhachis-furcata BCC 54312]
MASSRPQNPPCGNTLSCTVRSPPFAYAYLQLATDDNKDDGAVDLDYLQVKSYCDAALRQFLGLAGAAIPVEILSVNGRQCWVRVPGPDLGTFGAAITAWQGVTESGSRRLLRIRRCSDWLGVMVGADGQERLWTDGGPDSLL